MIEISNNDNFIDSREINGRIDELTTELREAYDGDGTLEKEEFYVWVDQTAENDNAPFHEECRELNALSDLDRGHPDWDFGLTLIRESYFEEYVRELANDLGVYLDQNNWIVVDWKATADNVRMDYAEVDFDGVTYLVR